MALACLALGACHAPASQRDWWSDATFYEVFVRSFSDSDGDGVGDLRGLTAHLDDLNDGHGSAQALGVDALWLMPIFPSPSYHGYDVTDYRSINPAYGTMDDFDALIRAAHARGIKVILDMVLNHSSSEHPWFLDSQQGPGATYRDYYNWRPDDPHWRKPDGSDPWHPLNGYYYYGYFYYGMPDLNLGNDAVYQELLASMKFWLWRGVDGFRFDAVRYYFESSSGQMTDLPATHAFIKRMRSDLATDFPNAVLVAEAWASTPVEASYYGAGDEMHRAFAFDQADAIKTCARQGESLDFINQLSLAEATFRGRDRTFEAPFLSNHDQTRVMRYLNGDAAAMRLSAATLFALPGTPFVYYGEELGMQGGGSPDDVDKRTPYPWNATDPNNGFTSGSPWYWSGEVAGVDLATERADSASLWSLYQRLIALRHARSALRGNDATRPNFTGNGNGLAAVVRTSGNQRILFVENYATTSAGAFTVDVAGNPTVLEAEGLAATPTSSGSQLSFTDLAPRGFAFVSLQ